MKNLSPALSIYKFPVGAISSITNRITGFYLTGVFMGYGLYYHLNDDNKKLVTNKYENLNTVVKKTINYSVIYSGIYHNFGALRHFFWDKYPKYLNNNFVKVSSYSLFLLPIIPTIILEQHLNNKYKNIKL